jgi:hypothetical protein
MREATAVGTGPDHRVPVSNSVLEVARYRFRTTFHRRRVGYVTVVLLRSQQALMVPDDPARGRRP